MCHNWSKSVARVIMGLDWSKSAGMGILGPHWSIPAEKGIFRRNGSKTVGRGHPKK